MFKFIVLAVGIAACQAGKIPNDTFPNGMEYLGTWNGDGRFEKNDYYVEIQSRNWLEARDQCETFSSGKSHLLNIETPAEYKFIKRILEKHGSARSFYIGAKYDEFKKAFLWDHDDTSIPSFIKAKLQHVQTSTLNKQSVLRLDLSTPSEFDVGFNTEPYPFICKVS